MALLNTETLAQLQEAVGPEAVGEIAAALRQTLEAFRQERPNLSREELGRRAHALKGSTSYLGTEELYAAALEADQQYKSGGDIGAALDHLITLIDPSLEALDAHLQSQG